MAALNKLQMQVWGKGNSPVYDFTTGLVAYWKMEGNLNDSSGNSYNATSSSGVSFVSGQVSDCALFDGTGNADFGDIADLSFGNGGTDIPFTMIVPFNLSTITGNQFLISKGMFDEWQLNINVGGSSEMAFVLYTSVSHFIQKGIPVGSINTGVWNHLIIRYDASKVNTGISLRLNNLETGNVGGVGTYTGTNNTTVIARMGARAHDNLNKLNNGKLDEIAVYKNRILTNAECSAAYYKFISGIPLIP